MWSHLQYVGQYRVFLDEALLRTSWVRAAGAADLLPITALATSLAAMLDFLPLLGVAAWRGATAGEVTLTSLLPCLTYHATCCTHYKMSPMQRHALDSSMAEEQQQVHLIAELSSTSMTIPQTFLAAGHGVWQTCWRGFRDCSRCSV